MPLSPAELAAKNATPEAPAPDVDPTTVTFREPPPKTIGEGYEKRELKRLTPEEKAARKLKFNLIMWSFGVVMLVGVLMLIGMLQGWKLR